MFHRRLPRPVAVRIHRCSSLVVGNQRLQRADMFPIKKILLLQSTAAHKVCPRRCDDNLSTGRQRKRRPSQMSSKYDLIRFISASEESGQVEKLPENKLISGRR